MKRRDLLKGVGAGSVLVAAGGKLVELQGATVLAAGSQKNYTFVSVDKNEDSGDFLLLNGAGRFDDQGVSGGGSFTHFHPDFSVKANGYWTARRRISFKAKGTLGS